MILLLAFAAAAAQTAWPPLTLQEAQRLSPRDLATRVLGAAGAIYREAHIRPDGGHFGGPAFTSITFATVPRSAGFPGLCVADRLYVSLEPVGGPGASERRPSRLDTNQVYRIVGDTTDRREGTDESENALEEQCARSGPVLDSQSMLLFFGSPRLTGAEAYMAARMLQMVIATAMRGPVEHVSCEEDDAEPAARACADPRALLAALPTDRLRHVEVDRCAQNPAHLCASLNFEQPEMPRGTFKTLRVDVEADVGRADPPPGSFRIESVAIHHETWIED